MRRLEMLATLVIGLREGLEAALIVGIIAAFLQQNGRSDALRRMWVGVGVAVVLCLAVGLALQAFNSSLPQRQQEMLECVVAAIAVVMVSYMVLWMRKHSRSLRSDLHRAAGGALASGSATALVVMAFLAVFREGFETAVFLLAAFQSAVSPAQAVAGAVLGIVLAVGLGYLIYRGGIRLNLSKFFRITGVVLVLVAAGLVMSTARAAYEAGWITIGQQHAVSLELIARPGTVQESLLTGVLGIRSSMPVIEVVAYLLYLVPMLLVVLWPAKRALDGARLGRVLAGTAAVALLVAGGLVLFSPAAPSSGTAQLRMAASTQVLATIGGQGPAGDGETGVAASVTGTVLRLEGIAGGTYQLTLSGHATVDGTQAAVYTGTSRSVRVASTSGVPATLTTAQMADLGNGRLPLGLSTTGRATRTAVFTDTWTPTVTVDPATGTVLDLRIAGVRQVSAIGDTGQAVPLGRVATTTVAATPASVTAGVAAAADVTGRSADHQVLGQVLPGLLAVFAAVLLAFAAGPLWRGRRRAASAQAPPAGTSTAHASHARPPASAAPELAAMPGSRPAAADQPEAPESRPEVDGRHERLTPVAARRQS